MLLSLITLKLSLVLPVRLPMSPSSSLHYVSKDAPSQNTACTDFGLNTSSSTYTTAYTGRLNVCALQDQSEISGKVLIETQVVHAALFTEHHFMECTKMH
jgi:hypothetical protein